MIYRFEWKFIDWSSRFGRFEIERNVGWSAAPKTPLDCHWLEPSATRHSVARRSQKEWFQVKFARAIRNYVLTDLNLPTFHDKIFALRLPLRVVSLVLPKYSNLAGQRPKNRFRQVLKKQNHRTNYKLRLSKEKTIFY